MEPGRKLQKRDDRRGRGSHSMNLGWFGVPPSGGSNGLDRLKPGLQAVRGFMVPMHAKKRKGALHEPARPSNCSLPWESGAEDARTPNADASSADSAASAKRLQCVRFIGAFRLARDGQRFMAAMHDFGIVALHEPTPRPTPPRRGASVRSARVSSPLGRG
jgi:hypothetical protein